MADDAKRVQGVLKALDARGQDPSGLKSNDVNPELFAYSVGSP